MRRKLTWSPKGALRELCPSHTLVTHFKLPNSNPVVVQSALVDGFVGPGVFTYNVIGLIGYKRMGLGYRFRV